MHLAEPSPDCGSTTVQLSRHFVKTGIEGREPRRYAAFVQIGVDHTEVTGARESWHLEEGSNKEHR